MKVCVVIRNSSTAVPRSSKHENEYGVWAISVQSKAKSFCSLLQTGPVDATCILLNSAVMSAGAMSSFEIAEWRDTQRDTHISTPQCGYSKYRHSGNAACPVELVDWE